MSPHSDNISFYKEEQSGEFDNMIHRRMTISDQHILKALYDTAEEVLLAILKGRVRDTWEFFISRYSAFHCSNSCYIILKIVQL